MLGFVVCRLLKSYRIRTPITWEGPVVDDFAEVHVVRSGPEPIIGDSGVLAKKYLWLKALLVCWR